jgi:hypothetical protein
MSAVKSSLANEEKKEAIKQGQSLKISEDKNQQESKKCC